MYSVIKDNDDTKKMSKKKPRGSSPRSSKDELYIYAYADSPEDVKSKSRRSKDEDYYESKKSKKKEGKDDPLQYEENGPVIYCNETDEPSMMANHNEDW